MVRNLITAILRRVTVTGLVANIVTVIAAVAVVAELVSRWTG